MKRSILSPRTLALTLGIAIVAVAMSIAIVGCVDRGFDEKNDSAINFLSRFDGTTTPVTPPDTGTTPPDTPSTTDSTVTIGNLTWMRYNLNAETLSGGWCYGDSAANCEIYGRLYNLKSAEDMCESIGWRLPTKGDWDHLVSSAGGANSAATTLKSETGWDNGNGTDDLKFSALPGGRYVFQNSAFGQVGEFGRWWSASPVADDPSKMYIMTIGETASTTDKYLKVDGLSVRCVKGEPPSAIQYTLTTNSNPPVGGAVTGGGKYDSGVEVTVTATANDGYMFSGWTGATTSTDTTVTILMDANKTVTANFTDTSATTYRTVTFNANNGSPTPPPQNVAVGEQVIKPEDPTRSGYTFSGWYTSAFDVNGWNFNTDVVTVDITLIAQWKKVENDPADSITINDLTWMRANLDIETPDSWCYDDDTSNCKKYGRLYTWEAAKIACATLDGGWWRLPTAEDWESLVIYAGGWDAAGEKLKSTQGWNKAHNDLVGTDEYGFAALPGGFYYGMNFDEDLGGGYEGIGYNGYWWSATKSGEYDAAFYLNMSNTGNSVIKQSSVPGAGLSVRCVK